MIFSPEILCWMVFSPEILCWIVFSLEILCWMVFSPEIFSCFREINGRRIFCNPATPKAGSGAAVEIKSSFGGSSDTSSTSGKGRPWVSVLFFCPVSVLSWSFFSSLDRMRGELVALPRGGYKLFVKLGKPPPGFDFFPTSSKYHSNSTFYSTFFLHFLFICQIGIFFPCLNSLPIVFQCIPSHVYSNWNLAEFFSEHLGGGGRNTLPWSSNYILRFFFRQVRVISSPRRFWKRLSLHMEKWSTRMFRMGNHSPSSRLRPKRTPKREETHWTARTFCAVSFLNAVVSHVTLWFRGFFHREVNGIKISCNPAAPKSGDGGGGGGNRTASASSSDVSENPLKNFLLFSGNSRKFHRTK